MLTENDLATSRLTPLAARQLNLEADVVEAEEGLKTKKKALAAIAEHELPDLMAELGFTDFTTKDGLRVTVKDVLNAATTGKYKAAIFAWLHATDNDSLITHEVVAKFGRGEAKAAESAQRAAWDLGGDVALTDKVNPQTFKALVRQLLADGEEVPVDEIGVSIATRSTIKV